MADIWDMPERILSLSEEVANLARSSVQEIRTVTTMTKMLSLNALIEAARVGNAGAGFAVVAREVGGVSERINAIATGLSENLSQRAGELTTLGQGLVASVRGTRLTDLALNMIEIIDRNLYERSCDVRWWATDSAVVDVCAKASVDAKAYTSKRLGVILDAYTVYLDIWVCDLQGNVLASGRPGKYSQVTKQNVAHERWFKDALATKDGTEFAVADVSVNDALDKRTVATYAAAVRAGGETKGKAIGVLGIFFDWQGQSQTVVDGVRLSDDERSRTRCLILDSKHRVIASSDRKGVLSESFALRTDGGPRGAYAEANGGIVGYSLTPGYETYKGLGWYGVIAQTVGKAK